MGKVKSNWLKVALKKKRKKLRKKKPKARKEYRKDIGAEFPIFAFSEGKRIKKIKNLEHFNKLGLHLGSVLLSVRDGGALCGIHYSYNKSVKELV